MKNYSFMLLTFLMLFFSTKINLAQDSLEISRVKAKEVIEKYLAAIGGKEAIKNTLDRTTIMRGTAMGQTITMIVKQKAPNKLRQEIKVGGMDQVIIFDGEKGVMNVMNQKIEVKDKELEALKLEASMDFLLDPESFGIKIFFEGTEKLNGKDANKLKMIMPSGLRSYSYFDAESGLKLKEQKEMQTQMGLGEQTIVYEDYKEIEGVKYPHKILQSFGGQSIEVTVSSIKVNKGLADDIFVIGE